MNIYEYFITKLCQEMVLFIHLLLRRQDLQIQMAVLHVCYCYLFRRCMPFKKKLKNKNPQLTGHQSLCTVCTQHMLLFLLHCSLFVINVD